MSPRSRVSRVDWTRVVRYGEFHVTVTWMLVFAHCKLCDGAVYTAAADVDVFTMVEA